MGNADKIVRYPDANREFLDFWEFTPETNQWMQKTGFKGDTYSRLGAVGFNIEDKGYVGLGHTDNDFWEFAP